VRGVRTTPHRDEKSAETVENKGHRDVPLRERVRKHLITLGLDGCDRKERTYRLYLG
jgi:hypothetical protein